MEKHEERVVPQRARRDATRRRRTPCGRSDVDWPSGSLLHRSRTLAPVRAFSASISFGTTLFTSPNNTEVGHTEDRRLAVLVHREDVVVALHADQVLRCTGDAERDVELRLHRLAGLADLLRVGHPARVDDRRDAPDAPPSSFGELLHERVVGSRRRRSPARPTRRSSPPRASAPRAPRRGARRTLASPARPASTSPTARPSAAPPPPGSAAKDFGRIMTRKGFAPENTVSNTVLVEPGEVRIRRMRRSSRQKS